MLLKGNQVDIGEHNTLSKTTQKGAQQSKVAVCIHIVQSFGMKPSNFEGINKSKMI